MFIIIILALLFLLPFFYFGPIHKYKGHLSYDVCIVLGYPAKKRWNYSPNFTSKNGYCYSVISPRYL